MDNIKGRYLSARERISISHLKGEFQSLETSSPGLCNFESIILCNQCV